MRFFAGAFNPHNQRIMKKNRMLIALAFACSLFSYSSQAQESFKGKRTFYIVRHAEKDKGNDPAISAIGKDRAGDLYRTLKDKKIKLIMATQYRRTGMTADSLRLYNKIDSIQYSADATGEQFASAVRLRTGRAKNILVVGHSNTLPALVRQLGVQDYRVKELPESEYDNLFVVTVKNGRATLRQLKYGKLSPPQDEVKKMSLE